MTDAAKVIALRIGEKLREIATRQGTVPFCTGDLRKSHIVTVKGDGANYKIIVGTNLKYARAIHDGAPSIVIRPKKAGGKLFFWLEKDGCRRKPIPRGKALSAAIADGKIAVAKQVTLPTRTARPWLRDSVTTLQSEGYEFLGTGVKAAVKKAIEGILR